MRYKIDLLLITYSISTITSSKLGVLQIST